MTSGLNTLLEELSSWVTAKDNPALSDGGPPDVITTEQLRERWVDARDLVSAAMESLNEPAPQAQTRPRSVVRRWMMNLLGNRDNSDNKIFSS